MTVSINNFEDRTFQQALTRVMAHTVHQSNSRRVQQRAALNKFNTFLQIYWQQPGKRRDDLIHLADKTSCDHLRETDLDSDLAKGFCNYLFHENLSWHTSQVYIVQVCNYYLINSHSIAHLPQPMIEETFGKTGYFLASMQHLRMAIKDRSKRSEKRDTGPWIFQE